MKDPKYKGEDFSADKEIEQNGPLKNRKCTDCIFLILIIAYIILLGIITNYAL